MSRPFSSSRARSFALVTALALAFTGTALTAGPAVANPAGNALVISEVYGGGGNTGATLTNDFIELYNPTASPISVDGLTLRYYSGSSGNLGGATALTGSVAAHGHFLVLQAAGAGGGTALPTPDVTGTLAMSGTAGSVELLDANGTIDLVGYGGAVRKETAAAPATSNATSSARNATGTDTDNNSVDFTTGAPTPQNSAATPPVDPPTDPPTDTTTIAAIQGTSETSPLNGQQVTTTGVVTAAYPTGGLNGFYLQTAGTGGASDATPGASDAVFVYGSTAAQQVTLGDYVQVSGLVTEFAGTTELTNPSVTSLGAAPSPVRAASIAYPRTEAGREAHEGELLAPTDQFTVTNNYTTNQYGEIGLATGTEQLWQPTDRADAQDSTAINAITADNAARAVTLDDASTWNYLTTYKNTTLPWLTPGNPVRVGSAATLHAPVILEFRNNVWKFQPQAQVTSDGADVATFSDTRAANTAPQPVGGNLKLATMNVLNYFNTTGKDWVGAGGTCTYYNDRVGDPVTDNTCTGGPTGQGPRGAAEASGGSDLTVVQADLERQRTKIVKAINGTGADIVSLEEVENSIALGEVNRDDALASLVEALNSAAGSTRWAFAPSPAAADLPSVGEQDVIRTAFIYNPATVKTVGVSQVLVGASAFNNAREPLAQAFKRAGATDGDAFAVIVNHFKSKGSGTDDGTGQGNANPDRVAQATALTSFATQFATNHSTNKIFLTGDFNSYSHEDPIQVLQAAGYTTLESPDPLDVSYQFGGLGGSLDHVLANPAALAMVTGVDVWQINAEESVGFEYSRYNYNATNLYQPNQFRASDHNPEVVGIAAPLTKTPSVTSASATPSVIKKMKTRTTVTAKVTGNNPTGSVTFTVGKVTKTAALVNGAAKVTFGPYLSAATYRVNVFYAGDGRNTASSATTSFIVSNSTPKN